MRPRRFRCSVEFELTISEELLKSVLTDEWRSKFYDLDTPGEVAAHIGYNLIQGSSLIQLEGFADQNPDAATLDRRSIDAIAEEI